MSDHKCNRFLSEMQLDEFSLGAGLATAWVSCACGRQWQLTGSREPTFVTEADEEAK